MKQKKAQLTFSSLLRFYCNRLSRELVAESRFFSCFAAEPDHYRCANEQERRDTNEVPWLLLHSRVSSRCQVFAAVDSLVSHASREIVDLRFERLHHCADGIHECVADDVVACI